MGRPLTQGYQILPDIVMTRRCGLDPSPAVRADCCNPWRSPALRSRQNAEAELEELYLAARNAVSAWPSQIYDSGGHSEIRHGRRSNAFFQRFFGLSNFTAAASNLSASKFPPAHFSVDSCSS
jgi:hypothetical protein